MQEKSHIVKLPTLIVSLQEAIGASPDGLAKAARAAGLEASELTNFLTSQDVWELVGRLQRVAASVDREVRLAPLDSREAMDDLYDHQVFDLAAVDPYPGFPTALEELLVSSQVEAPLNDLFLAMPPWPQLGAEAAIWGRRLWQSVEAVAKRGLIPIEELEMLLAAIALRGRAIIERLKRRRLGESS